MWNDWHYSAELILMTMELMCVNVMEVRWSISVANSEATAISYLHSLWKWAVAPSGWGYIPYLWRRLSRIVAVISAVMPILYLRMAVNKKNDIMCQIVPLHESLFWPQMAQLRFLFRMLNLAHHSKKKSSEMWEASWFSCLAPFF